MFISASVSTGFQEEIRGKIAGFGGHVQIANFRTINALETQQMLIQQAFYDDIQQHPDVENIQIYATKAGILQAKADSTKYSKAEKNIQGVVFKGVSTDFNWEFFEKSLIKGTIFSPNTLNDSVLISKYIADKLALNVSDKVSAYFIDEKGPKLRPFIVAGIYETGLNEFDEKFVMCDIAHIQQLNKWGIETYLSISDECINNNIVIEAKTIGNDIKYEYQWSENIITANKRAYFCPQNDTLISVITRSLNKKDGILPDTSFIELKVEMTQNNRCICEEALNYEAINDSTLKYSNAIGSIVAKSRNKGTNHLYCGGFEVNLKNMLHLEKSSEDIYTMVGPMFSIQTINQKHPEIFSWLDLLDTNVYVIITLLIVVAIINMMSTLLVIILEKGQTIGLLKALGSTEQFVSKVFVFLGGLIIFRGIIWGNALGLLLIFLQNTFEIIQLPQASYFVSVVPMKWAIDWFLIIDLGALIICTFALVIPAKIISKIGITKAIKFN